MSFQILLVYFDTHLGPRIFLSNPTDIDPDLQSFIQSLFDLNIEEYFEIIKGKYSIANIHFSVPSIWARGNSEALMLTVAKENHNKPLNLKIELTKIKNEILGINNIYKAFYQNLKDDHECEGKFVQLKTIFTAIEPELIEFEKNRIFTNILVLGLQAVGKTSIINRLKTGEFQKGARPTVGTQIIRTVVENANFQIYDVAGQKKLRNSWWTACSNPDGIVYVIDLTKDMPNSQIDTQENIDQFQLMLKNYELQLKTIPLLILGNKIDLLQEKQSEKIDKPMLIQNIKNTLKLNDYELNYKIFLTSATNNEGIPDGIKWLLNEYLMKT